MLNKASRPLRQARDKLRAWYLWAVAKGALKNGKAEAAPLSETTTTAARTGPGRNRVSETADAARPAVAKPAALGRRGVRTSIRAR